MCARLRSGHNNRLEVDADRRQPTPNQTIEDTRPTAANGRNDADSGTHLSSTNFTLGVLFLWELQLPLRVTAFRFRNLDAEIASYGRTDCTASCDRSRASRLVVDSALAYRLPGGRAIVHWPIVDFDWSSGRDQAGGRKEDPGSNLQRNRKIKKRQDGN